MPALVMQVIRAAASRLAAVIGAVLIAFLAGRLGLPVTETQADSIIAWLTMGLTGAGYVVAGLAYPVLHKLLSLIWGQGYGAPQIAAPQPDEAEG